MNTKVGMALLRSQNLKKHVQTYGQKHPPDRVFLCDFLGLVNVDFAKVDIGILLGKLFESGRDHLAGATPSTTTNIISFAYR
jgi:hypothetical protein